MWFFKRRPQQIVTINEKTLESAFISAMRKVDAERAENEAAAFKKDDTALMIRSIYMIFFFFIGGIVCAAGFAFALSCFKVNWACLKSILNYSLPVKIIIAVMGIGYGSGCITLGTAIRKIRDRNIMLAYAAVLTSILALIVAISQAL